MTTDQTRIRAVPHDGHLGRVVGLIRELDRGLARHDVGNSVWYATWRDVMAREIGVHELELAGRNIIEPGGPVIAS